MRYLLFLTQRRKGAETQWGKELIGVRLSRALASWRLGVELSPANTRSIGLGILFGLLLFHTPSVQAADAPTKSIPIAKIKHTGPVDFEREVLPILKNNCVACHNQTKPKGGLVLETPQTILKGGDAGPAAIAKKPRESLLLKAAAHQDPDLIMPPPDNKVAAMPLKPEELGLLQLWIEQGAKGVMRASLPVVWEPMPPGLSAIYAVALTRDGQFAACGRANQIFVYHLPSGHLVARLNDPQAQKTSNAGAAHRDTVNSLAFNPDGDLLASGGYRVVKLWRRAPPANQLKLPAGSDLAAMDGKWSAASITNGELRVYETNGTVLRTNAFPKSIADLQGDIRAMFLVAERQRDLAFAKSEIDYRKSALKAAETNQTAALTRQKNASETNAALAKVAAEKQTAVTNALAAQREAEKAIDDLGPEIRKLVDAVFAAERESTNAAALANAAKAGTDKVKAEKLEVEANAKSNLLVNAKAALDQLPAETKAKQKLAMDKLLAANKSMADAEREFKKAEQARRTAEHEVELADAAAQKTDTSVAAAKAALSTAEAGVTDAGNVLETAKHSLAETAKPIRAVAFSREDGALVTADEGGAVRFWNAETGAPFDLAWKSAWTLERTIGTGDGNSPLADRVNALRFTADNQQLLTGGGEPTRGGEIKLWRVNDGTFIREFQNVHSDSVLALDVSADGKYLASGAADRFAKVVDLATGKIVKTFEGHTHHVLGVSWKRDGRTLLSAGADNVAKVWDATTGERRKNIELFGKEVTAAAFVGVGDEAVLSGGDGQVVLVKANGDKLRSFAGATDYVYTAAITPDGSIVVSGGADGLLRTWDGKSGKLIAEFAAR
jgi:WD40 repeat protein